MFKSQGCISVLDLGCSLLASGCAGRIESLSFGMGFALQRSSPLLSLVEPQEAGLRFLVV